MCRAAIGVILLRPSFDSRKVTCKIYLTTLTSRIVAIAARLRSKRLRVVVGEVRKEVGRCTGLPLGYPGTRSFSSTLARLARSR
jgi:hypothetical protein